ncbi:MULTISPECIES: TRAP transporter small permease [Pseudorhizobium]|jgi:TRAP-type transport system small permease protein|uniref:TRAP transporter small permease protein n=1 Tax=Pseudorhizobium pelagicum TaxID=1509405 RepID=A0A922T8S2_9HYPH|nr:MULTISPECIES: TRAP transporter small permease [Pseudorhizobium]MBA4785243.1 TRAP transporter small permease [Hyphomicrobiales bacterium]MBU1313767.1 TRAP transporter small permease [Alphaproteobacteria bacterium]MDY6961761.1 TRAP transporter small permease [Pseudomonadota bacterium]KEQ05326.1 ABC transporter permease [Pseudorhizobium pelagicum]KEQ08434.1 ABC transporter permease [Pseudorhizobium pelagicum]|tara:strand:+ start:196 stop:729 length:534 start_codon:yes stop_codon:yes gene_type:complete
MQRAIDLFYKCLELLLILLLGGMAIMVFLNVVLRYGFNSGINVSDELSRYFFVWLTFIGAVVAFREHSHVGVETLVMLFGRTGRIICMILSNIIIIAVSGIFFWGTWKQAPINATMDAPVTQLSMIWVYGIGFFTGAGVVIIALERLLRLLTGRVTEEEIAAFAGENMSANHLAERA